MAAIEIFPLEVWPSQITQASIPANNNSLRIEVLSKAAIGVLSAPPGSPADGDMYVIGAAPSGGWSAMAEDNVVIYQGGAWIEYEAFDGWIKTIGGVSSTYSTGTGWAGFSQEITDTISCVFDGSGVQLGTGLRIDVPVPYDCTVDSFVCLGDVFGSVAIDVKKATYAAWPTDSNMAVGGSAPGISSAQKNTGSTSGWSDTAVNAGDIVIFTVQSSTSITRAVLSLTVTRS